MRTILAFLLMVSVASATGIYTTTINDTPVTIEFDANEVIIFFPPIAMDELAAIVLLPKFIELEILQLPMVFVLIPIV